MNRIVLAFASAALALTSGCMLQQAQAQSAEEPPTYCMMTAFRATAFAKKTQLVLDCGESGPYGTRVTDEFTGKAAKFNSAMDALNYMASQGYEDRGGYVLNANTTNPTYVYLLRKG